MTNSLIQILHLQSYTTFRQLLLKRFENLSFPHQIKPVSLIPLLHSFWKTAFMSWVQALHQLPKFSNSLLYEGSFPPAIPHATVLLKKPSLQQWWASDLYTYCKGYLGFGYWKVRRIWSDIIHQSWIGSMLICPAIDESLPAQPLGLKNNIWMLHLPPSLRECCRNNYYALNSKPHFMSLFLILCVKWSRNFKPMVSTVSYGLESIGRIYMQVEGK